MRGGGKTKKYSNHYRCLIDSSLTKSGGLSVSCCRVALILGSSTNSISHAWVLQGECSSSNTVMLFGTDATSTFLGT